MNVLRHPPIFILEFADAAEARQLGSRLLRMPDGKRRIICGPATVSDSELRAAVRETDRKRR
jgi:hypothetical protein